MIGKWNKSVILTYVGLALAVIGTVIAISGQNIKYSFICLLLAGVCDMFDGTIARKCKRNEEEKLFGVQLDSLVDTYSFISLPIVISVCMGLSNSYNILIYIIYAIMGIARLANFNITAGKNSKPVKYYQGLPVTTASFIFPIIYLLTLIIKLNVFNIIYAIIMLLTGILFVIKIKIIKPKLKCSFLILLLAIIISILYIFAL